MQTTLILVTLLTIIGIVFGNKTEKGCGSNPADIVFVLDESGSIWGPHFTQQLDFVQSTIEALDVGFKRTHIGVLTFATDNRIIFNLGQYTEEQELKNAVKAIKQKRGDTFTHLALKRLREEMFSKQHSRFWVRQVAIVITDGVSDYPKETEKEARLVHAAGFQMFAIGVGTAVDQRELEAIASGLDFVFKVDNYAALESLRQILAWKACEPWSPPCPPTRNTTEGLPQMNEVNGLGMTTIILVIAAGLLGFIVGIFVAAAVLRNWSRNVTSDPITSSNCQVVLSPDGGEGNRPAAAVDNYWHIMAEDIITTPSIYSELHPPIESHEVCSYENESEEMPHYEDVLFTMPSSSNAEEEEIISLPMEDGQEPNEDYLEVIT